MAEPAGELRDESDEIVEARQLGGGVRRMVTVLAVGLSLYALYWVAAIVEPMVYRVSFLLVSLVLTFILYPFSRASRKRVGVVDWLLIVAAIAALVWPLIDFASFPYRSATLLPVDIALGTVVVLLVLEATRRTVGWVLPATAAAFIVYAYLGPLLDLVGLGLFAHRGYHLDRIIGSLYMTADGIFGTPLDVASTYIILFSIYGAVLEFSGAGKFFIDWAMAAMRSGNSGAAPGRAVTLAGFLLGTVSGSGVATTVTLGSISWPLLRRSGYPPDTAGALLSAAGIGAIISPPTLGAAAFLIAEFLNIPFLEVLVMAIIPTGLYYLSASLMIEADARRMKTQAVEIEVQSIGVLTRRYWYHFSSLILIVVFMALGMTAFRAVLWALILAVALSFLHSETALKPRRLIGALESGAKGTLSVVATTATAGIIVGMVTLTGLGLKIAGLIVQVAQGNLFFTVFLAAIAVWILGLAVPVTASYIISAVMVAPALTQVGVAPVAAHMFIFYYAVLSEVSPPTALSPFAAAAITGGNPFRTMMLTWKYTLPAFLVPFVFTLSPQGLGTLLRAPLSDVLLSTGATALGIVALAIAFGGWIRRAANIPERVFAGIAGGLLFWPGIATTIAGLALLAGVVMVHVLRVQSFYRS